MPGCKALPVQMGPLALGLTGLYNVFILYGFVVAARLAFALALLLLTLLFLRIATAPQVLKEEIFGMDAIVAYQATCMALFNVARVLAEVAFPIAMTIWWTTFVINVMLTLLMLRIHVLQPFDWVRITPGWLVALGANGNAAVTHAGFAPDWVAWIIFVYWLLVMVPVYCLVCFRVLYRPLTGHALILLAICAAAPNLFFATYLEVVKTPWPGVATGVMVITFLVLLSLITQIPRYLALPFSPAFVSFTFPLALSATMMWRYDAVFLPSGTSLASYWHLYANVVSIATMGIIVWVSVRFVHHLLRL